MTRRKATQADVARLAGVSQATVSLVLNGTRDTRTRVASATQLRVMSAVQELGYSVNPLARSLTEGASSIIGVFSYEPVFPGQRGDFYQPFLAGIEAEAELNGVDLLLFTSAPMLNGRRRVVNSGWNRLGFTDGCIMLGNDDKQDIETLLTQRYPFVFVGRREVEGMSVPHVAADYAAATADITELLLHQGHRSIAYLGSLGREESSIDRISGYRSAMSAADLRPILLESNTFTPDEVVNLVRDNGYTALITDSVTPTAAIGAAAEAGGLRIPEDLSIAVIGDPLIPFAEDDRWSGFRIPREEMGRAALSILLDVIANTDAPRSRVIACTPVPGRTVAAPRGANA